MKWLAAAFALITAAAGWYYLFYSRAAHDLAEIEQRPANRQRVRLRQAGGVVMILLGVLFFTGFYGVDAETAPGAFATVWLAVFALLVAIMVLALIDMRLTTQLRRRRKRPHHPEQLP